MKIGEQRAHHPELMAGIDKDISLAAPGLYPARFPGRIFQRPDRSGSHRYDPASGIQSAIDGRSRVWGNGIRFAVQFVILHPLFAHRLKRA